MSRILKFKIWNKKSHKWCGTIGPNETISHNKLKYDPEDLVFCQFTGLTDQNGKEIYEGDIMASRGNYITDETDENGNFPDLKNVVIWNTRGSRFALKPIQEYIDQLSHPIPPELDNAWICCLTTFREVIGNVFEHLEQFK